jgi:pilus assembly protein Flp/PilA
MFSAFLSRSFPARLFRDESGASAVEYGLIVALVSVLAVAGLDALGHALSDTISVANSGMRVN